MPPVPSSSAGRSAPPGGVATTVEEVGEFGVIDRVVAALPEPAATTLLGPGDDSAVLAAPDGRVVTSVDVLVDGVHFRSDWATGEQIGRRAAMAAMSDVAAMGAAPTALLVGLAAPGTTDAGLLQQIGAGLSAAAAEAGADVVGGDLTSAPVLMISVTVIGTLGGVAPVLRSGAGVGDVVALTGRIGWAAAGLAVLTRGFRSPAAAVGAYRVPEPPLAQGPVAAVAGATAMIDVSDGLLADLGHIADASGVAIDLRSQALTVPARLVEVGSALGKDPLAWLLTGGDDHPLAATFPDSASVPEGWTVIGRVSAGAGVTVDGATYEGDAGWDHFRSGR
ncbi:MAG: thiamine-phosphate kinase [Nakamurella sp.]